VISSQTDRPRRSALLGADRRAGIAAVLRWVAIVVVVGAAVWVLASNWDEALATARAVHPLSLGLSLLVLMAGSAAATMSWQVLLDGLGPPVGIPRGFQIYLVGLLGKYVPGSVWAYLLQMELGKRHGVSRPRVLAASLFAAGIGVVGSLVLGLAALPAISGVDRRLYWLYAIIPLGLAVLNPRVMTWMARLVFRLMRRPAPDVALRGRTVAAAFGCVLVAYVMFGLHLWLLANSLAQPTISTLALCIGASGLGMTAGLFAFFMPSGLGAREAVLGAALATVLSVGQASALAVGSRIMFTVSDLALAGMAAGLAVLAARRTRSRTV
jgi:hypothetical protein